MPRKKKEPTDVYVEILTDPKADHDTNMVNSLVTAGHAESKVRERLNRLKRSFEENGGRASKRRGRSFRWQPDDTEDLHRSIWELVSKGFSVRRACEQLAKEPRWKRLLKDSPRPADSLRERYQRDNEFSIEVFQDQNTGELLMAHRKVKPRLKGGKHSG